MRKLLAVASALVILIGVPARGDVINLAAVMTNAGEPGTVTPTTTTGASRASSGTASFVLNTDNPAAPFMTFTATVVGIDLGLPGSRQTPDTNDDLLNAHIHASGTVNPNLVPPTNVGVVWGFFGSPFNDVPNEIAITRFEAPLVGGTISGKWDANEGNGASVTLINQVDNILAGRSYINFHTSQFNGGEIRGAIIPEPSSLALVGAAVVGLAGNSCLRRRKRRLS